MGQYQIPGARRPIEGPITDTTWQPPPQTQPSMRHYAQLNQNRYLNQARQELHTGGTVLAPDVIPGVAPTPLANYQVLQAPRYRTRINFDPSQGATIANDWIPPGQTPPELLHYAQLQSWRYQNVQRIDQQGKELFGPCTQLISFSWSADPTPGVDDYKIELGSAPGLADRYNIDTGGTDTFFQANILGGTYSWRVRSYIAGVPQGASSPDQVLVVTCDTFLLPVLTAQPDQTRYGQLNWWRYQNRAKPEVHQGLSTQTLDPIVGKAQPELIHYQIQQALRYQNAAKQYIHQGGIIDTAWQPPPQTLPELIHYLALNGWRYQNQARQDIHQGPIVDTRWQPPPKTGPALSWYLQLQAGRYQVKVVLVPGGAETPQVIASGDISTDLPELWASLTNLLGDFF